MIILKMKINQMIFMTISMINDEKNYLKIFKLINFIMIKYIRIKKNN